MNSVADIKRFALRYLNAAGLPLPEPQLRQACLEAFAPRPLLCDVNEAIYGLESDGFTQGAKDDLDQKLVTWTLTTRGQHKAKQIGEAAR